MRFEIKEVGGVVVGVEVRVSRRNLLAMLHKLDWPESARTLLSIDGFVNGQKASLLLTMIAEDDDLHYARREGGYFGAMHPDTERFIREQS